MFIEISILRELKKILRGDDEQSRCHIKHILFTNVNYKQTNSTNCYSKTPICREISLLSVNE